MSKTRKVTKVSPVQVSAVHKPPFFTNFSEKFNFAEIKTTIR